MPRRARKNYDTSFFHVIIQGVNREYIFEKEIYKKKFFNLLKENKEKYSIDIIAYVIMNNHSHLLLHVESIKDMSNFMKKINEEFARYYNYNGNRVGYVFRDRFLSEPITNKKYLFNCISYIHNNPVKANIVSKCEKYNYSSYNDYINKTNFISDEVLEIVFGTKTIDLNEYIQLHEKKTYYFLEGENLLKENMQEIITEIENRYKSKWHELIKYNYIIEKIGPEIKERIRISNSKLASYLKIHRHKLERILLKNINKNDN